MAQLIVKLLEPEEVKSILTASKLETALLELIQECGLEASAQWPVQIKPVKHNVMRCSMKTEEFVSVCLEKLPGKMKPDIVEVVRAGGSQGRPAKRRKGGEAVGLESISFRAVKPWNGFHPEVHGALLVTDFVGEEEESRMISNLRESGAWEETVHRQQPKNRRVQHYGFKFDYGTRRCEEDATEPLPNWVGECTERVREQVNKCLRKETGSTGVKRADHFTWTPNQLTINEYLPGQGIAPHVDTHSAFDDGIASLSLGSSSVMRFSPGGDKSVQYDVLLPARSLLIMSGPARYFFIHGIPQRRSDYVEGQGVVLRGTRYSLTFRSVKAEMACDNCPSPEMCDLG